METYGLTKQDLLFVREKIANQKDYLVKNEFVTSSGQFKNLLDVSFSANHSSRYYAQLANRVNTIEELGFNQGLKAILITMTLDGFYRDLLKGDYTRFKAYRSDKRQEIYKSVPNDDRFGYIRLKMQHEEKLSVKDLYKILLFQNRQFNGSSIMRLLRQGNYHFNRTVEPHKDGVPHFHALIYVPEDYIEPIHEAFKRFFVAPRNKLNVSFITDVNSSSAYIMKYITKTFLNVDAGNEIDYIQAWYVKHKIFRFVSSRTIVPQWIYKKCSIYEKDWYYITDILNSSKENEWSFDKDYFFLYDDWSKREITYFHGQLSVYNKNHLVFRAGEIASKNKYKTYFYEKIPKEWTNPPPLVPIYDKHDKLTHYYKNGIVYQNLKHITDLNLYELQKYYYSYDVDNDSYVKYLAIRNLMIDKQLIIGDKSDLSNFDLSEFFFGI